jgi:U3 small nucleolar RNA-associated protein 21
MWIFKRGKRVGELEKPHGLKGSIDTIITLGSWIIASTGNTIEIWKAATLEHYTTLTPTTGQGSGNNISALCLMPTFLNKVFAGTRDGNVEIWNISTG